jgi:ketosteroid isomerase-like protein
LLLTAIPGRDTLGGGYWAGDVAGGVTVVQASFDAFTTGDLDAWGTFLASDVIWGPPDGWPEPGPYIGRDAVLRAVAQPREAWDSDTAEPTEFIDAGDRVVAKFVWRGTGHGHAANMSVACVYSIRKGKIHAFEFFLDLAEALEAAGLRE